MRVFKKGDLVRVWSLQSFYGGGFINGDEAIVSQNQIGNSILLTLKRNINGHIKLDCSYEVYKEQIQLIKKCSEKSLLEEFDQLKEKIKQK